MRSITIAVILCGVINYASISGIPGSLDQQPAAYEQPVQAPDPDDDEDEHKVRTGRVRLNK